MAFGGQTVLEGASGSIRAGEFILLRGTNGSGKTTLLNTLTGFLAPSSGSIAFQSSHGTWRKSFHFPLKWYQEFNPFQHFTPERVARLGVGRTWQDVRLFPSLDLADNVAAASPSVSDSPWAALFQARRTAYGAKHDRVEAGRRLAALGLEGRDESSGDMISLGQSKRVAIARALHAGAQILFLDEPLAGLDARGVSDVISHLRTVAAEHNIALVIIEHSLNIPCLLDFVTTVWTLKNGSITASDPAIVREELTGTAAIRDIHGLVTRVLGSQPSAVVQTLPLGATLTTYALPQTSAPPPGNPPPTLDIRNLVLRRGVRHLFADSTVPDDGLTLQLRPGTLNVLEAPNGWGKTSLVNRLIGNLVEGAGTATLNGRWLPGGAATSHFFQAGGRALLSSFMLFRSLSVAETAAIANVRSPSENSDRKVANLSGGQFRRLALELLENSVFCLLDEFSQGLDYAATQSEMERIIRRTDSSSCLLFLEPISAKM